METFAKLIVGLIWLAFCAVIFGGFGIGSIIWLFGLFFNAGWSYMGVVRAAAVITFIIDVLYNLVKDA